MTLGKILADEIAGTRDWTLRLLADFEGDDWTYQPALGMGHALWLCGHLACAQNLLVMVRSLDRNELEDAFCAHFPIGGPVKAATEYDYPSSEEIRIRMDQVHQKVLDAVSNMSEEVLNQPAFGKDGAVHPHYKDKCGAIQHCSRHEAFHAGQLATIRRLRGKSFLR
jgi:hypothetical protein